MAQQYMDYHLHTNCSPDSKEPLEKHIQSAQKRGLSQICITDHWDLIEEVEGVYPTLAPPIHSWHGIYEKAVKTEDTPEVTVLFGVEVGDGYTNPQSVKDIIQQHPFDFVIGSVHSLHNSGGMGIYAQLHQSQSEESVKTFFKDYFHTLLLQSKLDFYDTLAHINYPFRYLNPQYNLFFSDYLEEMTGIFEHLIKGGRCLEVNTARGTTVEEWKLPLQRYRELGGTAITIGSDAHVATHLGLGIPDTVALLKSLGFDHYTAFEQRIPREIPIL